jgi:citrate lyase subunit beta/citryl-CoA lyase
LYVPTNVARFVEGAPTRGADAIQLDLEDSVPAALKTEARSMLQAAVAIVGRGGADVLVRINRPLGLAVRDIEAAVSSGVRGICITKVQSAGHVRLLDELVTECERRAGIDIGHTCFTALVETPEAFLQMSAIARASPRMVAMGLGAEDFALECGFAPSEETLLMPKQQLIFAARGAGISAMGYIGSVVGFGDDAAFAQMVQRSRRFGFAMATCVHPRQVAIVNEVYGVSAAEVDAARRILKENDVHSAAGRGAFQLDGKMVDEPVVERARRVVRRFEALARSAP